jgi:hypothetical protein
MVQLKLRLIVILACYMVTCQHIYHASFVLKVQHFKCFLHIHKFVSRILNVQGKFGVLPVVFDFPDMLFLPRFKRSSHPPDVGIPDNLNLYTPLKSYLLVIVFASRWLLNVFSVLYAIFRSVFLTTQLSFILLDRGRWTWLVSLCYSWYSCSWVVLALFSLFMK